MGGGKGSNMNVQDSMMECSSMSKQTEETAKVVGNFLEEIMNKAIK